MPEAAIDHRRATAERNEAAILDATERLLARRAPLSIAAIAAETGVSRPTMYAHFKTLGAVVERVVSRAVDGSLGAMDAAQPESGPAGEALERMLAASWNHLGGLGALIDGATEHVPADHLHRTHAPLMARLQGLVERGQRDGTFRSDLPADWLVTAFYSLVHAAEDHARARGVPRDEVGRMLLATVRDVFAAR
jgi:TetR/AcrR family transcriptional regulator, mexCD-oprJ operon repressor